MGCDQHVHTTFSFDGKMAMEEACDAAVRKGLSGLTFTEHFSVDPLDVSYGVLRYAAYRKAVRSCQKVYAGRLSIGCGLEIGEPHLAEHRQALDDAVRSMELDFIIGSIHNIGSVRMSLYKKGKGKDAIYAAYFQEVLQMVKTADIDVIGHMDLAKRYLFDTMGDYDLASYREVIAAILHEAIRRGIGIEVNTSGWRNSVGVSYPSLAVVSLYREMGGNYITIGSDAHDASAIGSDFERAKELLQKVGFDSYTHYEKRVPHDVMM